MHYVQGYRFCRVSIKQTAKTPQEEKEWARLIPRLPSQEPGNETGRKSESNQSNHDHMIVFPQDPPPGFELVGDDDTRTLVWTPGDIELPPAAIQLFANDTNGTSTARNVSIILCACINNGTCMNLTDVTLQYNSNRHYKLPCICEEFFDGDSCETDMRGCGSDPCPDYAVCEENDTVAVGYVCVECLEGYFLDAEDKCAGKCHVMFTGHMGLTCVTSCHMNVTHEFHRNKTKYILYLLLILAHLYSICISS